MDTEKATQELAIIRQLMERPVRLSTLSGAAGFFAGLCALGGVVADASLWQTFPAQGALITCLVWGTVFVVASAGVLAISHWRERREGLPFWNTARRRVARSCIPPYLAAGGLTAAVLILWLRGEQDLWGLIPAIWMICYGQACWNVGEFSLTELRVMGGAFILSAVAAMFLQDYPYPVMAVTFGGYHLVYGVVVWIRHGG
jgi:hypothetical protein